MESTVKIKTIFKTIIKIKTIIKMIFTSILLLYGTCVVAENHINHINHINHTNNIKNNALDTPSNIYNDKDSNLYKHNSRNYGLSISTGYGASNIVPIRLGLQKYWDKSWHADRPWGMQGYWEGSVCYMKSKRDNALNNNIQAYALAGVLRFARNEYIGNYIWPYFDIGLGASYLNKREIADRSLGANFQFEDRLGIGCRFGKDKQYELGYRILHYSNADLANDNDGINLHMIVFTYWL